MKIEVVNSTLYGKVYNVMIRNKYFDIIKGGTILLVIFGHCIQYGSGNEALESRTFMQNVSFLFIYSFHMPLFAVISGYFFYFSSHKGYSFWKIVKYKMINLLLPLFTYSIINLLIGGIHIDSLSLMSVFKYLVNNFLSTLWFLWAIFYCTIGMSLVNSIKKDSAILCVCIVLMQLFLPDGLLNLKSFRFLFPFFAIGYFVNKYHLTEWMNANVKAIAIISGCIFSILFVFFDSKFLIYNSGVSLLTTSSGCSLYIIVYRFVIGLVGCVAVLSVVSFVYKNFKFPMISTALAQIGTCTLGIYAVQFYLIDLGVAIMGNKLSPNVLYWIIETFLITILSFTIVKAMERSKILKLLFLGRK